MSPSRVRIPPSPPRSTERCPSGLRSATGNRVRAERCVAGSNPALSAQLPPSGGGNGIARRENTACRLPPHTPPALKPVCGYPRRVSSFSGVGSLAMDPVNIWDYERLAEEKLDANAAGFYFGGAGGEGEPRGH